MKRLAIIMAVLAAVCRVCPGAELRDPTANREYKRIAKWIADLDSDSQAVRAKGAFVLGNIGSREGIAPMVRRLVKEPRRNGRVVLALCYALGQLKAKEAYLLEIAALKHRDAGVRNHAAGALGEIGLASCCEFLIPLLDDGDLMVRRRAAESLRKLSGESFGYSWEVAPEARKVPARKWAQWWAKSRDAIVKREREVVAALRAASAGSEN